MSVSSPPAHAGWSQLPVRGAVAERGRIAQAREERLAAQKQALCKQVVQLQTQLQQSEQRREAAEAERAALQARQDELLAEHKQQLRTVRDLGDLNASLKDQLLVAQSKLEEVAEWRLRRERGVQEEKANTEALAEKEDEIRALRRKLADSMRGHTRAEEELGETKRMLQCQLAYAEDLCKANKVLKRQRADREEAACAAEARCARAQQEAEQLRQQIYVRDKRIGAAEVEARRLRRDRVDARRAVLDAEDLARERELLIREVTRENRDLGALVAAARRAAEDQQQDAVGIAVSARPVPVVEVEAGPRGACPAAAAAADGPSPVLRNLREHNGLLQGLLTNMLQQQSLQQRDMERRLAQRTGMPCEP
eukprot:TRINITY_DN70205_c0_g1_i1.p1 TRINITY_DN70205_c0_g1~~TRINITY_DN70205_c0_g1_i1.p1  ORF type:complete len:393 (+),score=173.69 TRINITY_DN70205_c0_g1_i1:80-1180(+)